MKFNRIKSFAKVNLSLNINGKLESKLHRIESLITFIHLHDVIYLKMIESNKHLIKFKGKFAKGIKKENTISKLLEILDNDNFLDGKKFLIKVEKNIPLQSGLGGGSMNASSILNYFIKKKIIKIKKNELKRICNSIGSDTILGISIKNTILTSKNLLRRFNINLGYYVLVVKPTFGCSTKYMYSKVKNYSKPVYDKTKKSFFNEINIKKSENNLEKIAFIKYPKLKKIKVFLSKLNNINFVRMTGSGSAILGYFGSKKHMDVAAKVVKKRFKSYWCIKSKTI